MKNILKKFIPECIFLIYHYLIVFFATIYYRSPSKKMIVIGVTGTKGKTSTTNFIWSALMAGGYKTGIISSANIKIGEEDNLNDFHMTMPGKIFIQKKMAEMYKKDCSFCVIETTSEGIKQHRNIGIDYDILVFTNLSPEHLSSHGGSFEKYKETKGKIFENLKKNSKNINGKKIEKIIITNIDNDHAQYFLNFDADKKITFSLKNKEADYYINNIKDEESGVDFAVNERNFRISIPGKFNVYNSVPAIALADIFNISEEKIIKGIKSLKNIPGRMEKIEEEQPFKVFVDYAHERESIKSVLESAKGMKNETGKIIILLGAEGGGRDKAKRPLMGEISALLADYVIVSNVDPYNDDPQEILEDIAISSEKNGKKRNSNLFVIEDRREGIKKALSLAKKDDIVLITGKGAEQSITIDGKESYWDDREVVREEIKILLLEN
jgi:UDP-N-acetylmuramoyl-L-alanyl-D-glutamate--2,6-diaminopimelate ligase